MTTKFAVIFKLVFCECVLGWDHIWLLDQQHSRSQEATLYRSLCLMKWCLILIFSQWGSTTSINNCHWCLGLLLQNKHGYFYGAVIDLFWSELWFEVWRHITVTSKSPWHIKFLLVFNITCWEENYTKSFMQLWPKDNFLWRFYFDW